MCIVSAVTDHYRDQWPMQPFVSPGIQITWEQYNEYMRLKRQAEEMDRVLNQPDCYKEGVLDWEEALRKYVEERNGPPPVAPV